jgi:hypothetical protein
MLYGGMGVLIMGVDLTCAAKRQRSAYFFVAAFSVLLFGGVMSVSRSLGFLPSNLFTSNGLKIGSAIEMILLAIALADRFDQTRCDKAKTQEEKLQAQAKALQLEHDRHPTTHPL